MVLNILVFLLILFLGKNIYIDLLGSGDSLNMWSPHPHLDFSGKQLNKPGNIFKYIQLYYSGQNGRVGAAILNSMVWCYSDFFIQDPQDFPWWLFPTLSLFCLIIIPFNFLFLKNYVPVQLRKVFIFIFFFFLVGFWTFNNLIYSYSVAIGALFTGYFFPIYFLSLVSGKCYKENSWERKGLKILMAFSFIFVGLFTEHFLVSLPFFFFALFFLQIDNAYFRDFFLLRKKLFWNASYITFLWLITILIYIFSPGQIYRLKMMDVGSVTFISRIIKKLPKLFSIISLTKILLIGALYLLIFLVLIFLLRKLWLKIFLNKERPENVQGFINNFKLGIFSILVLFSFKSCLALSLISLYLPPYALSYPFFLLLLGLSCTLMFFIYFIYQNGTGLIYSEIFNTFIIKAKGKGKAITLLAAFVFLTLFGFRFFFEVRKINTKYMEIVNRDRLRRKIYNNIIEQTRISDAKNFLLVNFPLDSYGWTLEAPWGFDAYFRWLKQKNISVFLEGNYDYPLRPMARKYFILDYKKGKY
jgi:hypothetical protein